MLSFLEKKYSITNQYLVSFTLVCITVVICFFSVDLIGYQVVALILLLLVSILAMLFDILPVLTTAILSAFIWNYFFIPPIFTFHIGTPEDALMFMMYFAIALINIVLTSKIRNFEKKARDKEEREKTIKLYNTLLNSLSHELRTPISTIIGAIDTINENNSKLSKDNKQELLDEIEIAAFRLNRQVDNLLNMSRLEAEILKPKLDWCDVNELIFAVIKNNQENTLQHTIIFEANEKLSFFKIDRGLIEHVLDNILHNALQYTPNKSTVKIEVKQNKENCQIIISDNGNGIPENKMKSVFDKFYRLPQTLTGGTGLGLAIAKGFTEAHNGSIKLENLKSGGAKFTIEIPVEVSSIINELHHE